MNKAEILKKIACWIAYCLFAGYSAYMTAKSVEMFFELSSTWVVFIFVFIVSLVAGYCLSVAIKELQNRFNPSRSKFILSVVGFLLFWGVSFVTNVHYMLMSNEGLKVVSAELGTYKSFVDETLNENINDIQEKKTTDITICEATVQNLMDEFKRECEASIRPGFGDRAIGYLKDIENYFTSSAGKFNDQYAYKNSIFDDEKDRGDRGKTGSREVMALKEKYSIRVADKLLKRESAINDYYKLKIPQTQELRVIKQFINDSLYVVDIPQITEIATPDVYQQFAKVQLKQNIYDKLNKDYQTRIDDSMKESKTKDAADIENGKFRYKAYPSARLFNTFNVWEDLINGRFPQDMKLLGWILFSLIVDLIAYILRLLATL